MGTLDGRVAIVTGAARGVGRGIALALAKEGARVAVADVLPADQVLAEVAAAGGEAWAARCDIRDSGEVDAFVAAVAERWGRVDICVDNVGIGHRDDGPAHAYDDEAGPLLVTWGERSGSISDMGDQ